MTRQNTPYKVVDLFAGPGGLAEGFSSILDDTGQRAFDIVMSVEKEASAHRTLRLRAFTRQFNHGELPEAYYDLLRGRIDLAELAEMYADEWQAAEREAILATLGSEEGDQLVYDRLDELLETGAGDTGRQFIVIGGPPCQAYSLIGRARNAGRKDYDPETDDRHFLYREYISILSKLQPAAFVMENVKGMLSSSVGKQRIFEKIMVDLERPGRIGHEYLLLALAPAESDLLNAEPNLKPRDFIVRAEEFGIPQARHRVFIVGVRKDLIEETTERLTQTFLRHQGERRTTQDVIANLPALRSGLSRGDAPEAWSEAVRAGARKIIAALQSSDCRLHQNITEAARNLCEDAAKLEVRQRKSTLSELPPSNDELERFLRDPRLSFTINHESRGHMADDLTRYLFCAIFARVTDGQSPRARDFPAELAPAHSNWTSGKFADRFKVQVEGRPSTTVTSHISKDGHYYIHPDPEQCRSLTVREAARLQTFPDNDLFQLLAHFRGDARETS
ncbi:DNA cytosine methyltransferase [Henriciella sp.]|uniref:DNA cytosine methyltransferase n=1 Tax=Henriciella sp. TaxID=1968823 RepID=UPI0026029762|nr:DNA cytosine methyltransferase [Henriciella sp.]